MDGLPGDAEGVPDLLPRPAPIPGEPDAARLYLLGEPVQRTHGPQTDCRIVGLDADRQFLCFHGVSLD